MQSSQVPLPMTLSYVKMKDRRNINFESATGPRLMCNISSDGPLVIDMLNGFNLNFQFLLKQGIRRNFSPGKKTTNNRHGSNKAIISRTKLTKHILDGVNVPGTPFCVVIETTTNYH